MVRNKSVNSLIGNSRSRCDPYTGAAYCSFAVRKEDNASFLKNADYG